MAHCTRAKKRLSSRVNFRAAAVLRRDSGGFVGAGMWLFLHRDAVVLRSRIAHNLCEFARPPEQAISAGDRMTRSEPSALAYTHPSTSPYSVNLQVFEGPLDLLLHLIRINEVEITDIPIARVAEQYLEYLDVMRELDLDVVGEYLLMAATLAWIKSRMLLPVETDEEGEEIDPRAELVARLLEYQRFKEVAGELGERRLLGATYSTPGRPARLRRRAPSATSRSGSSS